MSEGSSRSSQEGLDGDGRPQATVQWTQTASGFSECRPHPPVTRVCTSPHVQIGQPRLQLNIKALPRATGNGPSTNARLQPGDSSPAALGDNHSPPPYHAHHRLAVSQSSPHPAIAQQPPLQQGRRNNATSMMEAQIAQHGPEWQDWQRDRWQIWQLLSSENADTLPETLVWPQNQESIRFVRPLPSPASEQHGVVVYVRSWCFSQIFHPRTTNSHFIMDVKPLLVCPKKIPRNPFRAF